MKRRLIDNVDQFKTHKEAMEGLDSERVKKGVLKSILTLILAIVAVLAMRFICHNYPEICQTVYFVITGQN